MFENLFLSKPKEKTPDALKSEHLNEGVRPILASINDHEQKWDDEMNETISKIGREGEFVDFAANQNNMLNAGEHTYVISNCSESSKWSESYWNCTGVAVIGVDKETGKEISILTHQNPEEFLGKNEKDFESDLSKVITNLLGRTEKGTVDAVVFGGYYGPYGESNSEYLKSIKKISKVCASVLGYEPVVLTGPNRDGSYSTNIFLDTQKRRLYIVRPSDTYHSSNQSYNPSDIKKQKKKWGKSTFM